MSCFTGGLLYVVTVRHTELVVSLDFKDLIKYVSSRVALIIFVKLINDSWLCSHQWSTLMAWYQIPKPLWPNKYTECTKTLQSRCFWIFCSLDFYMHISFLAALFLSDFIATLLCYLVHYCHQLLTRNSLKPKSVKQNKKAAPYY